MSRHPASIGAALLILLAAAPAWEASAELSAPETAIQEHLALLDRALQTRLRVLENRPLGLMPEDLRPEIERTRRHLGLLEIEIHRLGAPRSEELIAKVRAIEVLARRLEGAAAARPGESGAATTSVAGPGSPEARRGEAALRQASRLGEPANDDCEDAMPIGNGTVVGTTIGATPGGEASCGFSGSSPDVWFRYRSPVASLVFADTLGSGFDTVLSAYSACPGTLDTETTCNDNAVGLQSAVSFFVGAGEEVLLRVSGFAGGSGPLTLEVGLAGAISGRITSAATGDPVASLGVEVFDRQGAFAAFAATDPAGRYTAIGLAPGTYFAVAGQFTDFLAEVYDGVLCEAFGCSPAGGMPIEVELGAITTDVDFALDLGGTISGVVREAATGDPISFSEVLVFDAGGRRVKTAVTGSTGHYAAGGLRSGSHFVRTLSSEHSDELYDGVPCPVDCDPTLGAPVAVSVNATVAGVDFALERLGGISGMVTAAATGEPIDFVAVEVTGEDGHVAGTAFGETGGRYHLGGLAPGTYFARTLAAFGYSDELFDDVPCPRGECEVASGTPIAVSRGAVTEGVDFALERLGSISGTVREAAGGDPLAFVEVQAFDERGFFAGAAQTDAAGRYTVEDLASGSYRVRTSSADFLDQLFDDLPCPRGGCDLADGTPVAVERASIADGVDFELVRLGEVSGRVTEAATGAPVEFVSLRALGPDAAFGPSASTDATGRYTLTGLLPGTYRVRTEATGLLDELYDGVPCPFGACDLTAGTPLAVGLASTTDGIDFALDRLGSIAGTVSEEATSDPIPEAHMFVYDAGGAFITFTVTDVAGRYAAGDLPPGEYAVLATGSEHVDELFDGLACENSACDLSAGAPVTVVSGSPTEGVDFALAPLGAITGTVRDAPTGVPVFSALVEVYLAEALPGPGAFVGFDHTDGSGRYRVSGLFPGGYVVQASSFPDHVFELYRDVPCPAVGCSLAAGRRVEVGLGTTAGGIDFQLDRSGGVSGAVTDAVTGGPVDAVVLVWDADGANVNGQRTDAFGRYVLEGLPAGSYFVSTLSFPYYDDEVYDGLACPQGVCDPAAGTPVAVGPGAVTGGIDLALTPRCVPSATALCLQDDRFEVEVAWRDFTGDSGPGLAAELTDETGTFWFFDPDNVELVVKVLDGCFEPFDTFWVYAGGLTDVETVLTVTEVATGESRTYTKELGAAFQPIRDTRAFATCPPAGLEPAAAARRAAPRLSPQRQTSGSCVADRTTLCLDDGRFEVEVLWQTAVESGDARAVRLSADTGFFWFFSPDNVEVVVKVLDACELAPFHNFWVFAAGLTDVGVTLRVTDTVSTEVREYTNPLGTGFQPIRDTAAFPTCP